MRSPLLYLVLFFSLLSGSDVYAYCAHKLTHEHSVDSALFSYHVDQVDHWAYARDLSFEGHDLEAAQVALNYLYEALYCQSAPEIDLENSGCSEVKAGRWFSTQCYLETNDGYFFVHKDLTDHVHLQFHRWD